jgi:hypothetical protein
MIRFVGMWKNWFLYKNKDGAIPLPRAKIR